MLSCVIAPGVSAGFGESVPAVPVMVTLLLVPIEQPFATGHDRDGTANQGDARLH